MKNTIKIISVLLIALVLMTISVPVYAGQQQQQKKEVEDDVTSDIMGHAGEADTEKVTTLGGKVVGVIQAVGTVVAIVMLLVVGITYLTKSPEGKAEYKKSMGNYIIGALLIFGAATVVNMLYSVANGL